MNFPWRRAETELQREIAHHLNELTAEYERQGFTKEEAQHMAKREFGGSEQAKERCRDERRWAWTSGFGQDIVFGWRMMRRTPVVTAAAVLSLALAIGANTAIVSLMDLVLWRDLPLPNAQQLENINWRGPGFPKEIADGASGSMFPQDGLRVADFFSYASFQIFQKALEGNASLAAFANARESNVSFAGEPNIGHRRLISGNFFSVLKLTPAMGRMISEVDDTYASPATVTVSYPFWVRVLHSSPDAVGKTLSIDNQPFTITGVMDSSFDGLFPGDASDLYIPLHHGYSADETTTRRPLDDNRFWGIQLIGRRQPGFSESQMQVAMDTAFPASWSAKPKKASKIPHIYINEGRRGLGFVRNEFRNPLLVLGGLVGLLLLIACTNIANLLLSRAAARQKEVATRISLGCGRARLMRQFVTESAMLAALGGVSSVAVAYLTQRLLSQFLATRWSSSITVGFGADALWIVFGTTLVALLLFGIFPAWRATQTPSAEALKNSAGSVGIASRRKWNSGRVLTVGQMAMSVVLVTCAVIFTRNLLAIQTADPGFDRRNLVMFDLRPGTSGYEKTQLEHFYFNLERELAATPGVTQVGLASYRPMNIGGWWETIRLEGQTENENVALNGITPAYLSLYTPRLVAGRNIQWSDISSKAKVAVISEDLARKLGGLSVLGKIFNFSDRPKGQPTPQYEIVGIVAAFAETSMKERPYVVWLPLDKEHAQVTVVARTSEPPRAVLAAIQKTVAKIDRNLPLIETITMEEQIAKGLKRERMFATVCSGFGILALVLSVVGLYGVIAYHTARRSGEIGIRLVLGALPREVVAMIVREGMALVALGVLLGVPLIWLGAKYVQKELFQMKSIEPITMSVSLGILLLAALAAVAIPAVRASMLQPAQTLRQE